MNLALTGDCVRYPLGGYALGVYGCYSSFESLDVVRRVWGQWVDVTALLAAVSVHHSVERIMLSTFFSGGKIFCLTSSIILLSIEILCSELLSIALVHPTRNITEQTNYSNNR